MIEVKQKKQTIKEIIKNCQKDTRRYIEKQKIEQK